VTLPAHIAAKIEAIVATSSKDGFHIDAEAARHGGVALFGSLITTLVLRSDGTVWETCDELDTPPKQVDPNFRIAALAAGAERHPWLRELLPSRPAGAADCSVCRGLGWIRGAHTPPRSKGGICMNCNALGWLCSRP